MSQSASTSLLFMPNLGNFIGAKELIYDGMDLSLDVL